MNVKKVINIFLVIIFTLTTLFGNVSTAYANSSSYQAVDALFELLPEKTVIEPKQLSDRTIGSSSLDTGLQRALDIRFSQMDHISEEIVIPDFKREIITTKQKDDKQSKEDLFLSYHREADDFELGDALSLSERLKDEPDRQKIHMVDMSKHDIANLSEDGILKVPATDRRANPGETKGNLGDYPLDSTEDPEDRPMNTMSMSPPADGPGFVGVSSESPFLFNGNANDGLNYNSGALRYEDRIAVIPGRNGLDLELTVQYSSDRSLSKEATPAQRWLPQEIGSFVGVLSSDHQSYYWLSTMNPVPYGTRIYFTDQWDLVDWMNLYRPTITAWIKANPQIVYQGGCGEVPYYEEMWTWANISNHINASNPIESMGDGWRFKFPRITIEYSGTLLHMADGSTFEFDPNGANPSKLKNYPGSDMVLTREANGSYTLSYHNGRKEFFNSAGMITRISDRFGNQITFAYDSQNIWITDTNGQVTRIAHTSQAVSVFLPDNPNTAAVTYYTTARTDGTLTHKIDNRVEQANMRQTNFRYWPGPADYYMIDGDWNIDPYYGRIPARINTNLLDAVFYPNGSAI